MSKYGSYPNPDLCDKHGKALQDCLTCSFDGNCHFQDKLELIQTETLAGRLNALQDAVKTVMYPPVNYVLEVLISLMERIINLTERLLNRLTK